jgi:gluconolactonase
MKGYLSRKLLDLPHYTEGPAVDKAGDFFFTTLSAGRIGRYDKAGHYSDWSEGVCPNGQVILANGEHWFCNSATGAVSRYNAYGNLTGYLVRERCAGIVVSTPNDLIVDSNGHLYFTDSIRDDGKVFFKANSGDEYLVAAGIDYPNGLVLSHDEKYLFIAESFTNRILVIELREPGISMHATKVFAELPRNVSGEITGNLPDGLALDREGRLWVAHYGMGAIQVISRDGVFLQSIDTSLPLTSNLCFIVDEPQKKILLVTGGYGEPGPGAIFELTVYL